MDRQPPRSAPPEPRPEAKIAAINGRLIELDHKLDDMAAMLADLQARVAEMEKRWELVKTFGDVRKVRTPSPADEA